MVTIPPQLIAISRMYPFRIRHRRHRWEIEGLNIRWETIILGLMLSKMGILDPKNAACLALKVKIIRYRRLNLAKNSLAIRISNQTIS